MTAPIKILPAAFAEEEERLARFEREAKLLAALNHSNIASIHGLEQSEGQRFLVLELAEGETLQAKLDKGPIEVEEALHLSRQITEGLEAAHAKGIIHRDLKPGNIVITPEGMVKILDFGLAKAFTGETTSTDIDIEKSPTITAQMTRPGMILGTAAYMSPEQARGRSVDKRTDIWAFGCVLFECLSGMRTFGGETVSDTIAHILKGEPDWSKLPANTPGILRRLLRRCLQKNAKNRLHDIADARIDIQDALSEPPEEIESEAGPGPKWRTLFWATVGLLVILSCVLLWSRLQTGEPQERLVTRFEIDLPSSDTLDFEIGSSVVLSPDGTQLVYVTQRNETTQLFLRPIHDFEAQAISGTEGAKGPFFSADGNWVAFYADGKLKKVSLQGGTPQVICDAKSGLGGTWSESGTIYFGDWKRASLMQVSAAGGDAELLATGFKIVNKEMFEHSYFWPQILPGGKALLFTVWNTIEDIRVVAYSLETGDKIPLIDRGGHARYLHSGYLIYAWAGDLMAVSFDPERLAVTGSPTVVLEGVHRSNWGLANFSLSETGSLVYVQGSAEVRENALVWVDLEGNVERLPFQLDFYQSPRIAPNGKDLVITRMDNVPNLWIYGLERGTMRRLTDEQGSEYWAEWTLDGTRIVFNSTRSGSAMAPLLWKPADGSGPAEPFTEGEYHQQPKSWSPDGKLMAIAEGLNPETGMDIWMVEQNPLWSFDGSVLYYRSTTGNKMMAVSFVAEPELQVGQPKLLFEGNYYSGAPWGRNYDLTPDGTRFIMITDESQNEKLNQINVILNWSEELKRLGSSGK